MRRPVLIVIAVAAGIVALLIVAVALVLATMDVNGLAQPLRAQVKAATGRDLTIAGLSLKLSLEPRIEMRDVTFGNAPWAHAPALVTAKRVDAQLALVPLLKRRLEIRRLTLVEPVIALETNAAGRGNWEFGNPPEPGKGAPVATPAGNAAGLAVGIGDLDIQRGMLTYRDGRTAAVTRVAIESFALHAGDLQAPVNASFRGVIDGVPARWPT